MVQPPEISSYNPSEYNEESKDEYETSSCIEDSDSNYYKRKRGNSRQVTETRISPIYSPGSSAKFEDPDATVTYEKHFQIQLFRFANSVGDIPGFTIEGEGIVIG